jgi:hypothetical protein
MRLLLITLLFFLTGCWGSNLIHQGETVRLSEAGTTKVDDTGFELKLWFGVSEEWPESIQYLDLPYLSELGVESHKQQMWIPDYQIHRRGDLEGESYHRRVNTVYPGKTEGAPWNTIPGRLKGVVMISGWLDENGEPLSNRRYFNWGGKQGGEVVEQHEIGLTYIIEYWTSGHINNPIPGTATLRLTVLGTDVEMIWNE